MSVSSYFYGWMKITVNVNTVIPCSVILAGCFKV